jgi:peptide chain release factor 3
LQFEVLEYRLKNEYGVDLRLENLPFSFARWIVNAKIDKDHLGFSNDTALVVDQYSRQVVLFSSQWVLNRIADKNRDIEFLEIPPSYQG